MPRILWLLTALCLCLTSVVYAAETFCGVGEYYAEPTETVQKANDTALREAMRRVSEQAAVALKSRSVAIDNILTTDEVEMATASVMRIIDRKFTIDTTSEGGIKSTATIIAEVDMDKAEEMANKLLAEKTKNYSK